MLRNIAFLLILSFSNFAEAQQETPETYLEVRGISELEMNPLAKATAILYEGTTRISSVQTGHDGSFTFKLDINKQYTIQIEKEGLISKCISFNTQMPAEEKGKWMSEFSIGLVKSCAGVDYSVLKQPVDRISFDPKRREYISDRDYVNSMRPKIEALMMKTDQCLLQNYEDQIKKADQAAKQNNLEEAKRAYQEALKIYPTEEYPAKRIAELNHAAQKQQVSQEIYKGLISEADALAEQGRLTEAIQKYEKAGNLNPSETYPGQKISELKKTLSEQQSAKAAHQLKEDRYNQALAKASVAYTRKDFIQAKQFYQEALSIKPDESLPKSRMQEITEIENKKAAENALKAEEAAKRATLDKEYLGTVAQADQLFREKKFEEAMAIYAKANSLKPAESYPAQRIKAAENAIASEQAAIQKSKDDGYNEAMASANNAIVKNQFELAKASYQKALTYKPDDLTAKKGILESERMAAEFLKRKNIEEQYNQAMTSAEALLAAKNWNEAKAGFTRALNLKPGDKVAMSKITLIENNIASEETSRLKKIEDEYNAVVSSANKAVAEKMYSDAKQFMQKALGIKPGDPYATKRISEIDRLISEDKKRTEQEQNLARQYQEAIASADKLFADHDYLNAKNTYSRALQVKPGDQYASQKIFSIDNLIASEEAAKAKQVENSYASEINRGNSLLVEKKYADAKECYQKALLIKPGDNNAKAKIGEVDLLLKQQQESAFAEQTRKKKYNDAITMADQYFSRNDFVTAKSYYEQALTVMPGEVYPRQKLDESVRAIEALEKSEMEKKARENAYAMALTNADKFFKAKDLQKAREEYVHASSVKPEEMLPKNRISEIDNLIAAREAEQAKAKARSDAYAAAINAGNDAFARKDYKPARESYELALKSLPGDILASDQIKKIDYLLAEAEKIKQNEEARKTAFNALISSADNLFDQARYSDAKIDYKKALALEPANQYVKQRIARIDEINRLLSQAPAKSNQQAVNNAPKTIAAIPMGDLNFKNESERQLYLNELVKKYPAGVTLEKYVDKYKETLRFIIIRNNAAQEFRHIRFTTYNGNQYSVNGKPITQQYFKSQTQVRDGETYKEIVMQ